MKLNFNKYLYINNIFFISHNQTLKNIFLYKRLRIMKNKSIK